MRVRAVGRTDYVNTVREPTKKWSALCCPIRTKHTNTRCGQNVEFFNIIPVGKYRSRSQWPRRLWHRSVAAGLLISWVRIPPRAWMFVVSVVCCQVEVSATSWSLVQSSPTDGCVVVCDLETSWMRRPWPTRGCCAKRKLSTETTAP